MTEDTKEMVSAWHAAELLPRPGSYEAFCAGWIAARMPQTVPEHSPGFDTAEQSQDRFAAEWNNMVYEVSNFATKWDLPKPQMVFDPKWLHRMNSISNIRLAPVIVYMDVKIRFGYFEQADMFKSV